MAVRRRQLEDNPFKYIRMPKASPGEINTYNRDECGRILRAARDFMKAGNTENRLRWDLLITLALATALRRGELLNCTWADIDFEAQTIKVAPKDDTAMTWKWLIKDTDRRTLPITDELTQLLADHQSRQPEGYPYVFVPPARYDHIQQLRAQGRWTYSDSRLKLVSNFSRDFGRILARAGVKKGKFHDLRRTAICHWFAAGMSEFEVMKLAGHANFTTTHKFYLAVADDLVDRARRVTAQLMPGSWLRAGCARESRPEGEGGCRS